MTNYRTFRGAETKQVDADGQKAHPNLWYWEPTDYVGDVLWDEVGYPTRPDAEHEALNSNYQVTITRGEI